MDPSIRDTCTGDKIQNMNVDQILGMYHEIQRFYSPCLLLLHYDSHCILQIVKSLRQSFPRISVTQVRVRPRQEAPSDPVSSILFLSNVVDDFFIQDTR